MGEEHWPHLMGIIQIDSIWGKYTDLRQNK
jgi:hypothetical protein